MVAPPTPFRHQFESLSEADLATLVLAAFFAVTDDASARAFAQDLRMSRADLESWGDRVLLAAGPNGPLCVSAELAFMKQHGNAPGTDRPPDLMQRATAHGGEPNAAQLDRATALIDAWRWGRDTAPDQLAATLASFREKFAPEDAEALAEFHLGHQDRCVEASVA